MSTRLAWDDGSADAAADDKRSENTQELDPIRMQRANSLNSKANAMKAAKTSPSPVQSSVLADHSIPVGGVTLFAVPETSHGEEPGNDDEESGSAAASSFPSSGDSTASRLENDLQRMGLSGTYDPEDASSATLSSPSSRSDARVGNAATVDQQLQQRDHTSPTEYALPAGIFSDIVGPDRNRLLSHPQYLSLFVSRPAPQGIKVQCKVYRYRDGFEKMYPQYEMFLEEPYEGKTFLLAARKRKKSKTSNYVISSSKNMHAKGNDTVQGKVRANFIGTAFTVYDDGKNPFKKESSNSNLRQVGDESPNVSGIREDRKEVASIIYEPNLLGFKGPRKMTVITPGMKKDGTAIEIKPQTEHETILERYKNRQDRELLVLHNKQPQWNDETRSFVLNFSGRVTVASVKNFQIVHDQDLDYIIMQFGRVAEDVFTLDYQYPLTALQAFGIAMSSFAGKLACE